jgi:hypothetical protein
MCISSTTMQHKSPARMPLPQASGHTQLLSQLLHKFAENVLPKQAGHLTLCLRYPAVFIDLCLTEEGSGIPPIRSSRTSLLIATLAFSIVHTAMGSLLQSKKLASTNQIYLKMMKRRRHNVTDEFQTHVIELSRHMPRMLLTPVAGVSHSLHGQRSLCTCTQLMIRYHSDAPSSPRPR